MLKVTGSLAGDREGVCRRSFLQAGVLGVGGLSLAELGRMQATGAVDSAADGRSVILFWLSGGPGHMETWDPKPEAVSQYKGPFAPHHTAFPCLLLAYFIPHLPRPTSVCAVSAALVLGLSLHPHAPP